MSRSLPVPKLLRSAHNFAERHVAECGNPDPAAFDKAWDAFCARNQKLTYADIQVIYAYASAALHYTPRKRYWAKEHQPSFVVTFIPIEHEAIAMPRGLWAGKQGNIAPTVSGEAAA